RRARPSSAASRSWPRSSASSRRRSRSKVAGSARSSGRPASASRGSSAGSPTGSAAARPSSSAGACRTGRGSRTGRPPRPWAGSASGVPILFVCLARPDRLETRPGWAVPQQGRTMLELQPLPEPHAQELVALLGTDRLSEQAQARIVETGEGNPLFLEQLVAVQASGEPETLPPSVQAVLAARIDRLDPGERAVLAPAA